MALQFSVLPIKSEVEIVERINNTIEAIPRPIINIEPIAFPAENPDTELGASGGDLALAEFCGLALADISILILFLLFYYFFAFAELAVDGLAVDELALDKFLLVGFVTLILELLPTNAANGANGNVIGILPKKIINRTTNNNNNCPPIIKIKSDVEVSMTHFSIPTIFV
jgi:hypothetical protein